MPLESWITPEELYGDTSCLFSSPHQLFKRLLRGQKCTVDKTSPDLSELVLLRKLESCMEKHLLTVQPLRNEVITSLRIAVIDICFGVFWVSQHITNPRKAKGQQDLVVNNPLSQDEGVSVQSTSVCESVVSYLHANCDPDTFTPDCFVAAIIDYFSN